MCETTDGNYIIAGTTTSFGSGGSDIYIIKIDTSGGVIWEKTYGGSGNEQAGTIVLNSTSDYVISGITDSYGSGGYDAYLLKINELGDTIWTRKYGGAQDDYANTLRKTVDGGFVFSGFTYSYGNNMEVYLVKTRADGFAEINEVSEDIFEFSIYPNPCSDILSLSSPVFNNQNILIKISNASGSVVMETNIAKLNRNIIDIDVSYLPSGVYLLSVLFNETQISKKLIIY
jgi:hypothetical protein